MTTTKIPKHVNDNLVNIARDAAKNLNSQYVTDFGGEVASLVLKAYKMGLEHQKTGFPVQDDLLSKFNEIPRGFRSAFLFICNYIDTWVLVPFENNKAYAYKLNDIKVPVNDKKDKDIKYSAKTCKKLWDKGLLEIRQADGFDGYFYVPSLKGYSLYGEMIAKGFNNDMQGFMHNDQALNAFKSNSYKLIGKGI
jgi:hypothetical protein